MSTQLTSHGRSRRFVFASFLYLWLMVGMFFGTFVLLLPVRWILAGLERLGTDQAFQNLVLMLVILAYVVVSALFARWLQRRILVARSGVVRYGVPVIATALAITAVWLWSNPGKLFASLAGGSSSKLTMASGAIWEFGRYPDSATLSGFKSEGYTAVITLEHSSDLVERQAIIDERRLAREIGIKLVEAPMLPWISNNQRSLALIRRIASQGTGRYYVHCGLGRDRVNLVKHMLEGMGARTVTGPGYLQGNFLDTRIPNFERGQLGNFGNDKWIAPYPNDYEMLGNFIQGRRSHVILALDTTDTTQLRWEHEAVSEFRQYAIPFDEMPTRSSDSGRIRQIASRLLAVPSPAAVLVPLTPWEHGRPRPGSGTSDLITRDVAARTHRNVVWTTNGPVIPGQPVERGNTEMPPPSG
ncbi:MAG TPA: hypothetical protein VF887_04985 [Gemmatimonadaceae bacterium]